MRSEAMVSKQVKRDESQVALNDVKEWTEHRELSCEVQSLILDIKNTSDPKSFCSNANILHVLYEPPMTPVSEVPNITFTSVAAWVHNSSG